jgi:beta-lactamase regulating signal transducer with metallopeptidase domain
MTAFAWALVHFVWQGALVGAMAVILRRLVTRPTVRYAIGVGALALMAASVGVTFALERASWQAGEPASSGGQGARPLANSSAPLVHSSPIPSVDFPDLSPDRALADVPARPLARWQALVAVTLNRPGNSRAIVFAWLIGVLLFTLRLTGAWIVTRRLATRALHPIGAELKARAQVMAERLALTRPVRLFESAVVSAPMIVGWLRPIVLMPAATMSGLSIAQIDALIAHELAHLRRHDPIVNLLQSVAETLLFYHPAVWWVSRSVRRDREFCCDDLAISVTGDRLTYVTALADLASQSAGPQVALAAGGGSLVERIARVLGQPERRSWTPAVGAIVLLSAIALVALAPLVASTTRTPQVPASVGRTDLQSANSGGLRRPPAPRAAATAAPIQIAAAPAAAAQPPIAQAPPSAAPPVQMGSIEGRVVTTAGAGVPKIFVNLLGWRTIGNRDYLVPIRWGSRVFNPWDISETDAQGRFTFTSMEPGHYFLVALPEPFARSAYTYLFPAPEGPTGYAPAYYPSVARAADAKPIEVAAGRTVRDISITVPRVETGTIVVESVPARSAPRDILYSMTDIYPAPEGDLQRGISMQRRSVTGSLRFEHVPVGQYILTVDPQRRVVVRAGQTTTVTVLNSGLQTLRAKVSVEGPGAPPPMRDVAVRFEPSDDARAVMYTAMPAAVHLSDQGEFQLWVPPPAILRVDPPAGWALKRVMLNGRDITELAIDFTRAPEGLEIVLTAVR